MHAASRPLRAFLLGLLCAARLAAEPASSAAPAPWHASATARSGLDTNVFLQDPGPLAPGQTIASTPARAHDSFAMLGLDVSGAFSVPVGRFVAGYAPELYRYNEYSSENHDDHRLRAALDGAAGDWSWELGGNVLHTEGSGSGPAYNRLGGGPVLGGEPVRARRDQTVSKASARLTRATAHGWTRLLACGSYQDFHTGFAPGASPYVDRGEALGGFELGRDLRPGLAAVAGLRTGRQFQADRPGLASAANSSSAFTRFLAGLEGRPAPTLKLDFRAGPAVHRFTSDEPLPLGRQRTSPHAEASATWIPSTADTVTFSSRYQLALCGGGRGAYQDSLSRIEWKHRCTARLSSRLGASYATGDNGGQVYPGAKLFRDTITTGNISAEFSLSSRFSLDLGATCELGASRLPDRDGRDYLRSVFTAGLTGRW